MRPGRATFLVIVCACLTASAALAQSQRGSDTREAALRRLQDATGGAALVSPHKATGRARGIRLQPGARGGLGRAPAPTARDKQEQSAAFFRDYGAALGISDPQSLRLVSTATDRLGETHLTWKQFYGAIPVFAATMKTHFDASHQLKAVAGTAIPDITVNPTPTWSGDRAAQVARGSVAAERGNAESLRIGTVTLYVYREGLAQGVPGENHLAWEVEVTDGARIRDFVYVGAHTGKVIDRISAVHDDLDRRAYDGHDLAFVPPNYPQGAYWLEGQPFPTGSEEANNMILASEETYGLFNQAFGRDSFDGEGATMDAIFDRGYGCPNASWNGVFISFCPGVTTDDVTAHEWGHAYTQYTHNLIYAWQPGALNESYSDIWGETVDLINGRGSDTPGGGRAAAACSTFSPPVGTLTVNAPASIAGDYFAQSAAFGQKLTAAGVPGDVVAAIDAGTGAAALDGCTALLNAAAVNGKIALIDRGTCEFSTKVLNAQVAGAIAVIIANNTATGLPGMGAGVDAPNVTIPSLGVQQGTGNAIRTQLTGGAVVNATLKAQPGTDFTYRWLMGEDSTAFNGAIRDMWNPACYSNPGKVTDTAFYVCSAGDQGGVHTNSGVPNHGYALLVDGGTYNGQDVAPIGITKAAHIYFRAQSVYQVEDSDFADHADALVASCADLVGQPLDALTGGPSGETISLPDCAQVTAMIAAVELRTPPTFCNFTPLLNPSLAVAFCSPATTSGVAQNITSFDFESDPTATWAASRTVTSPDFTDRDWSWVNALPSAPPNWPVERLGSAGFFAPNPNIGTCAPGGDESGVLHLTSPPIALPMTTSFARATFDHWVATEAGFDGGNVKISVNGGPWQLVPPSEFTFNNYNALLVSADGGNTDPLAGQPAWTGNNAGTVKGGSWGRSHLNLGNFARAGDTVRLRWDLGSDGCAGSVGWYLDNVNVFSCTPNVPSLTVADIAFAEGDAGRTNRFFTVRLSVPTIRPVAVNFEIVDGTAQHGNDFETGGGGTLVIPAGATSGRVTVVVKGDIVPEGNETFFLRLTGAANATIADSEAQATINDDDTTPPGPPGS
jgi:Zn-dependent metalloprotease